MRRFNSIHQLYYYLCFSFLLLLISQKRCKLDDEMLPLISFYKCLSHEKQCFIIYFFCFFYFWQQMLWSLNFKIIFETQIQVKFWIFATGFKRFFLKFCMLLLCFASKTRLNLFHGKIFNWWNWSWFILRRQLNRKCPYVRG